MYDSDLGEPTESDIKGVADATLKHMGTYIAEYYAFKPDTIFLNLVVVRTGTTVNPATIRYEATVVFDPTSAIVPSQTDVDTAVRSAFGGSALEELFVLLDALPPANPLSQTWGVTYEAGLNGTALAAVDSGLAAVYGSNVNESNDNHLSGLLTHMSSKTSYSMASIKSSSSSSKSKCPPKPGPTQAPVTQGPATTSYPSVQPSLVSSKGISKSLSAKSGKLPSSKSFYNMGLSRKSKKGKSKKVTKCPPTISPSTNAPAPSTAPPTPRSSTKGPASATAVPTSSETSAGPSSSTTTAPTSGGGGDTVQASPFYVIYDTNLGPPTEQDLYPVADLTIQHLEGYFADFFETSTVSILVDFAVVATDTTLNPPSIAYRLTAAFDPNSDVIPTPADLDLAIQTAFTDPAFQALFELLDTLPPSNPFSQTWGLTYEEGNFPARINPGISSHIAVDKIHRRRLLQTANNIFNSSPKVSPKSSASKSVALARPARRPANSLTSKSMQTVTTNVVVASPFNVTFSLADKGTPTEDDFGKASAITEQYIGAFFKEFFERSGVSNLVDFDSDKSSSASTPRVSIELKVSAGFSSDSYKTPSQSDLDLILQAALSEPIVDSLVWALSDLSTQNPFSTTTTVSYVGASRFFTSKSYGSSKSTTSTPAKSGKGLAKGSSRARRPSGGKGGMRMGRGTSMGKGKGKGGSGSAKSSKYPSQRSSKTSKSVNECPETLQPTTKPTVETPTQWPASRAPSNVSPTSAPAPLLPTTTSPSRNSTPSSSPVATTGPSTSLAPQNLPSPPAVVPTPLVPSSSQAPFIVPSLSPTPPTTIEPATSVPSVSSAPAPAFPSTPSASAPPTLLNPSTTQSPSQRTPSATPPSLSPVQEPSTSMPEPSASDSPVASSTPTVTGVPTGSEAPIPIAPSTPSITPFPVTGSPAQVPTTTGQPSPSVLPPSSPSAPSASLSPASLPTLVAPSTVPPAPPSPAQVPSTAGPASPSVVAPSSSDIPSAPVTSQSPVTAPTPTAPSVSVRPAFVPTPSSPSVETPSPALPSTPSATQLPVSVPTPNAPSVVPFSSPSPAQGPTVTDPASSPVSTSSPATPASPSGPPTTAPSTTVPSSTAEPSVFSPVNQPTLPTTEQPASAPSSSIQPAIAPVTSEPASPTPVATPSTPSAVAPSLTFFPTDTPPAPSSTLSPAQAPSRSPSPIATQPIVGVIPTLPPTSLEPTPGVTPMSPPPNSAPAVPSSLAPTPRVTGIVLTPAPTPGATTSAPTPEFTTITTVSPTAITFPPTPGSCFSPEDAPFEPPAGITVGATPFNVDYSLDASGVPTQADFDEAATTTCRYVREQLCIFFSTNVELTFEGITCEVTSTGSNPTQIGYQVLAVFSQDSLTVPNEQELDFAMVSLFSGSVVDDLVAALQELPSSNPFSTTAAVSTDLTPAQSLETEPTASHIPSMRLSSSTLALLAVVGASIILSVGIVTVHRHRGSDARDESTSGEAATMEIVFEPKTDEVSQLLFTESYDCYLRCNRGEGIANGAHVCGRKEKRRLPSEPDGVYMCDDHNMTQLRRSSDRFGLK